VKRTNVVQVDPAQRKNAVGETVEDMGNGGKADVERETRRE
jgi:hypothetical protein